MAAMWPVVLLAAVSGMAFELAKWVVGDVRRHVYNGNRNRRNAERKSDREERVNRNMTWWTGRRKDHRRAPLAVPEGFVEGLCRQWDKVHDSTEEMVRFGEMMVELDDYVDNSFIFNASGDIIGRHPGMKGFLEEECGHVGYSTAIRYRLLAMKAREAERRRREVAECGTACGLGKVLDVCLGVAYRCLERPRRRCRRPRRDGWVQPAIFSMREAVRSAGRLLDVSRRRRIVDALREIAREVAVS